MVNDLEQQYLLKLEEYKEERKRLGERKRRLEESKREFEEKCANDMKMLCEIYDKLLGTNKN